MPTAAAVLLGLQVTLGMLWALGPGALVLAVVVVATTLPFTIWLGGVLGVDRALAQLVGTGTAICGASAIVAGSSAAAPSSGGVAAASSASLSATPSRSAAARMSAWRASGM